MYFSKSYFTEKLPGNGHLQNGQNVLRPKCHLKKFSLTGNSTSLVSFTFTFHFPVFAKI